MASEMDKMRAGEWYTCHDPELFALQDAARAACHAHNTGVPNERGPIGAALAGLFAELGEGCMIEAPFHCAYGVHIHLGARVYMNAGCTILDTAEVRIGDDTMLGPRVQIYCPTHHKDRAKRVSGLERARPVTIGREVWIAGGAILLPGVTVGDGAIVGAGSVVTRDVAPDTMVFGNPARVRAG